MAITCRDGKLYSIKNGDVRGSAVLIGEWCSAILLRELVSGLREGERKRDSETERGRKR